MMQGEKKRTRRTSTNIKHAEAFKSFHLFISPHVNHFVLSRRISPLSSSPLFYLTNGHFTYIMTPHGKGFFSAIIRRTVTYPTILSQVDGRTNTPVIGLIYQPGIYIHRLSDKCRASYKSDSCLFPPDCHHGIPNLNGALSNRR